MSYADVEIKSNSKYLKIESGQPHDIRLLDEDPTELFEHQTDTGSAKCPGMDQCAACQDGDYPNQRFGANIYDHNSKKVLVWKYGGGVAKQLKAIAETLAEEGRSMMEVDLKVDATGSSQQKRYTVTPRLTPKPLPEGLGRQKID
jgi:hypothetical protein